MIPFSHPAYGRSTSSAYPSALGPNRKRQKGKEPKKRDEAGQEKLRTFFCPASLLFICCGGFFGESSFFLGEEDSSSSGEVMNDRGRNPPFIATPKDRPA